jgi:hypothetical protein
MFGTGILRLKNSNLFLADKRWGERRLGEGRRDVRVSNEIKRVAVGCPFLILKTK